MPKRRSKFSDGRWCTTDQAWMYTGVCPQTWRKWLSARKVPGKKDYRGTWQINMVEMFSTSKAGKFHDLALLLLDNLTFVEEFSIDDKLVRVILRAK